MLRAAFYKGKTGFSQFPSFTKHTLNLFCGEIDKSHLLRLIKVSIVQYGGVYFVFPMVSLSVLPNQNHKTMKMQVKDIMTSPVVTAESGCKIAFVRELMERKKVSAIPIVKINGKDIEVKGIITATDLVGVVDEDIMADEVMTKNVQVIPKRTSVQAAAAAMLRNEVHHLVVLHKGYIIGIISSLDFARMVTAGPLSAFARMY